MSTTEVSTTEQTERSQGTAPGPRPFSKVLVANRGEIAVRVLRTCRAQGYATVAVFSDADAAALQVRCADEAVRLGPAAASASYLNAAALIAAARQTGADAIHPGYGFLSENAEFVEACVAAGLVFIGPSAATMRAMGDKAAARQRMAARGVPVVPGYDGEDQREARLVAAAAAVGYPVLVKASAGGGGKGMSVVRAPADLPAALATARRLAQAAFGDDRLIIERYVDLPRHVEVQIFGDHHGRVIHLFERECSVQRRFQKIVEESPSPALNAEQRARLCAAGVAAGEALGYVGAGTVEFILDAAGDFHFLEVNTRLQVEHPVTEALTGLDLVAWQLKVAAGWALPPQAEVSARGHAVECRLYAEDPDRDFLPSAGPVLAFAAPTGAGVRVDAGVAAGSVVGIDYDPLLAKVVTWGEDRAEALRRMDRALADLHCAGVVHNRGLLRAICTDEVFASGVYSTHFLAERMLRLAERTGRPAERTLRLAGPQDRLADAPSSSEAEAGLTPAAWHRVVATLWAVEADAAAVRAGGGAARDWPQGRLQGRVPGLRPGWRNLRWGPTPCGWRALAGGPEQTVGWESLGAGQYTVTVDGHTLAATVAERGPQHLVLAVAGVRRRWRLAGRALPGAAQHGGLSEVWVDDGAEQTAWRAVSVLGEAAGAAAAAGSLAAPMPGRVVQVCVALGEAVAAGAPLVVLEAMKMEQTLSAPRAGVVTALRCAVGDQVEAGTVLVALGEAAVSDTPAEQVLG